MFEKHGFFVKSGYIPTMLEDALQTHFGFDRFRDGQEEVIRAVVEGRDAVVVMPTGSGKSICYQLPAMLLPGLTLVVSPLIALMKDQVEALRRRFRLPATFVNSTLSWHEMRERLDDTARGRVKLLYAAPERLRDPGFLSLLEKVELSLLAVDEAHCVSQWGHDFRPDYLRIGKVTRQFPGARVMALTATATGKVREDIITQLGLGRAGRAAPEIFVHGFERPNLHVAVTRCGTHHDKFDRVLRAVDDWGAGIVYCSTRKQVERVCSRLRGQGLDAPMYHGGMKDADRERVQNRFMNREVSLVVATNAFGMGVDRADVRFVLHWDVPGSMEAYYQEIGRAGRDGAPAWCELLFNYADVRTQEFFLEGANPSRETILELLEWVRRRCAKGPRVVTAEEWAEDLATTSNPMAVRTALFLLERAGCIQRQDEPGSRTQSVLALPKFDAEKLAQNIQRAEAKARRDRAKLDAILAYVGANECRHRQILRYFGDKTPLERCRACDVCSRQTRSPGAPLTEDQWVGVQKILSAVARLNGQYGRARFAEMLKGSESKGVFQSGLHHHRCYGLLKDWTLPDITRVMEDLLADGCLEQRPGAYPVLEITERGRQAVWRKVQPHLRPQSQPAPDRREQAAANADPAVLRALKTWRKRRATAGRLKPFQVFHNSTLEAIADALPENERDLREIPGIGPTKLARYGKEVLQVVARHKP